ncbi:HNH endonuclease [Microbacterium sp. TPD7012]|uniref:HNH endonuclease n=1 Tax=Microbacterium sp. TPD7012 TaxID=2171975 RepID=UPI000D522AFA|nr:HNH endonuclease [Microbacterium sp. TPD7012]PVE94112.1 hypothetical protein DC434_15255 [Microbacterium sp. TPD7012]
MPLTSHAALRTRLLLQLVAAGGSARRRDVLDAFEEAYGHLWSDDDLLPQTTRQFETKWRNRTSFERQRMVEQGLLEARADGIWALTKEGWSVSEGLNRSGAAGHDLEVVRREKLWSELVTRVDVTFVAPQEVRKAGLYAGARGIYVDVENTRHEHAPHGIALTFLDLGVKYANQISESGVVYHFPATSTGGRDRAEINATRRAYELAMPVFVITLAKASAQMRAVYRAFVEEIDESTSTALLTFLEDATLPPAPAEDELPFSLVSLDDTDRWALRRSRPNQARFAFRVKQRYGDLCAVCDLAISTVIEAAHLRSKSSGGADDPRNGIALCSNHHRMLDSSLWAIEPQSLRVATREGRTLAELGITRESLAHLPHRPHDLALEHAWSQWQRSLS